MKTSRRNFMRMLGAAIAAPFAPKVEIVDSEPVEESSDFYDYLDSVVDSVEWRAGSDLEWNLEGKPADIEKWRVLLDSCECEPLKWHVNYGQCDTLTECEGCFEFVDVSRIEPGAEVYITHDNGDTWQLVGEIA